MNNNKTAFTLTEIIVSVFISTIILSFLFLFINDSISSVSLSKNKSLIVGEFNEFNIKIADYKLNYSSGSVIGNNLLLKNNQLTKGVLIGVVNLEDNKLETDFSKYGSTFLGYRDLSQVELNSINLDNNYIYNVVFSNDKIYKNMHIKSFDLNTFNSGSIFDLNISINPFYQEGFIGESWSNLDLKDLFKLNLTL